MTSNDPTKGWYNGYSWKQREEILQELKRLRKQGDLKPLAYLDSGAPCEVCGDPDFGSPAKPKKGHGRQWHSEDYSIPYRFAPPATFIICSTCHLRLHKRFPDSTGKQSDWKLYLAHLRSGGYGWEFTHLYPLTQRRAWQADIEAGRQVDLPTQRPRRLTGTEWWQTLTLDPQSLTAAWARPRP